MLTGREHVERYLATDGAEGHDWNGMPILLLTTTGRKSGARHTTALAYQPDGDDGLLVVASKRGAAEPPHWYLNLVANPRVEVQVKADRYAAEARTATEDERGELWRKMTDMYPGYDELQVRAGRQIPVVILTRVSQ
ncbi:nitroreductase family deazaflavin-dependent oxidoreductase [Actinomadura rupiterrae]|uniref:nitroreductase family deazaflavin-dependent oxidoreductase n=1 Tax=Actinomadura rupiterrae TaxID=559627 RepID=UPI0020A5150A|nr:nitroreductase family deazaflavin-dependent oxidoreductase [Actinomadura rupiterrae]MCP2342072.1 deazaflavin-dependent oxidoreductase (nitroreductase family) [Actinomadura rupiterrae]